MLVKHIHVAPANRKDIAVHVLDLALSTDAEAGFEMIPVLQKRNGVSAHDGVADAKTHAVLIRQKAVARTIAPNRRSDRLLQCRADYAQSWCCPILIDPKAGGRCSAPERRLPCRAADCGLRRNNRPSAAENLGSSPTGSATRKRPAICPTATSKNIGTRVFRSRWARTNLMYHVSGGTAACLCIHQNAAGDTAADINCLHSQIWQVVSFLAVPLAANTVPQRFSQQSKSHAVVADR